MKFVYRAFVPTTGKDNKIKASVNGQDKIYSLSPEQDYVDLDPITLGAEVQLSYLAGEEYIGVISFLAGVSYPYRGSNENIAAKLINTFEDIAAPVIDPPVVNPEPVVVPVVNIAPAIVPDDEPETVVIPTEET